MNFVLLFVLKTFVLDSECVSRLQGKIERIKHVDELLLGGGFNQQFTPCRFDMESKHAVHLNEK